MVLPIHSALLVSLPNYKSQRRENYISQNPLQLGFWVGLLFSQSERFGKWTEVQAALLLLALTSTREGGAGSTGALLVEISMSNHHSLCGERVQGTTCWSGLGPLWYNSAAQDRSFPVQQVASRCWKSQLLPLGLILLWDWKVFFISALPVIL